MPAASRNIVRTVGGREVTDPHQVLATPAGFPSQPCGAMGLRGCGHTGYRDREPLGPQNPGHQLPLLCGWGSAWLQSLTPGMPPAPGAPWG